MRQRKKSFFVKVSVYFTAVGTIVALLMGGISYYIARDAMVDTAYHSQRDLLFQTRLGFKAEIEKNITMIMMLYNSEKAKKLLSQKPDDMYGQIRQKSEILKILRDAQNTQPSNNSRLLLFGRDGTFYGIDTGNWDFEVLRGKEYFDTLGEKKSIVWEGGESLQRSDSERRVIRAVKAVTDRNGVILYYIVVETDEKVFWNLYRDVAALDNRICFVDEQDQIVSSNDRERIGAGFEELYGKRSEEIRSGSADTMTVEGKEYLVLRQPIRGVDWSIVELIPMDVILKEVSSLKIILIFLTVSMIGVSVALAWHFCKYFGYPIRELVRGMKQVIQGKFQIQIAYERNDEMKVLVDGFNFMVKDLKIYMDDFAYQQKLLRRSEIRALQAQINPHFLYNTLESVVYLARENSTEKIAVLVKSLIGLLRRSVGGQEDSVTIREEMEAVEEYLNIQNIRYEDKIKYSVFIEDDIRDCRVPRLILQPIVENAVIHGIVPKKGPGLISLWVSRDRDEVCIEVMDNGVGMGSEEAHAVLSGKRKGGSFSGIGIRNVQDRIRALYGEKYGLSVENEEGMGTVVVIRLPFQKEEDNG